MGPQLEKLTLQALKLPIFFAAEKMFYPQTEEENRRNGCDKAAKYNKKLFHDEDFHTEYYIILR